MTFHNAFVSPANLKEVLGSRGRTSLPLFIRGGWDEISSLSTRRYMGNWHIDATAEHLQAASSGQIRNLIINFPPRHMKSLTCNVFWPAWDWIANPGRQFLFASYRTDLCVRDGDFARELVESEWYVRHYGRLLPGRMMRSDDYFNAKGGRRLVVSVFGKSATGDGGDIMVIDDAISADQARSPTMRKRVIDWWDLTMKTRLNDPKTGIRVIIMQRLHEEDLTGHILANETGFDHLCIPARYEPKHVYPIKSSIGFKDPRTKPDELLWPERFGEVELDSIAKRDTYLEAGQLQQRPTSATGGMFPRDTVTILNACPPVKKWVRGWDLAGSLDGDYTVGLRMGLRTDGEGVVIASVVRFRKRAAGTEAQIYSVTEADNKAASIKAKLPKEPGQAGLSQMNNFAKLLRKFPIGFEPTTKDKETRAAAFSSQWELGRVYLVKGAWNEVLINEFAMFPKGAYDDQVDAGATAYNELAHGAEHEFW